MADHAWLSEYQQGHYRKAVELLQPLVEVGDAYCLLSLGTMYLYGMHHFDSEAEFVHFMKSTPSEIQREFWASNEEFVLRGVQLLAKASEMGSWVASENLATYYTLTLNGMTEQERVAKAGHYYELVEKQRRD